MHANYIIINLYTHINNIHNIYYDKIKFTNTHKVVNNNKNPIIMYDSCYTIHDNPKHGYMTTSHHEKNNDKYYNDHINNDMTLNPELLSYPILL